MSRIVCEFSCGAASAVATKLILAQHPTEDVAIINAFVKEEHEDNRRFLSDCEVWFGRNITVLRDEEFGASTDEVWMRRRFMVNSLWGAPCSMLLKRTILNAWKNPTDRFVIGYTVEERHRVEKLLNFLPPERRPFLCSPLVERNLGHADCEAIIERAGIVLPMMYRLGYNNANCIGCPKGGEGYWNKIRRDFPDRFAQVQAIQENIGEGAYFFRNRETGERFGLKHLDPNSGRHTEELPSCSFFCVLAEQEMSA
jgi:hypothetical protein